MKRSPGHGREKIPQFNIQNSNQILRLKNFQSAWSKVPQPQVKPNVPGDTQVAQVVGDSKKMGKQMVLFQ